MQASLQVGASDTTYVRGSECDYSNDVYSKVKGPEKRGYIRCIGRMPTVKENSISSSIDSQTVQQRQEELARQNNALQEQLARQNNVVNIVWGSQQFKHTGTFCYLSLNCCELLPHAVITYFSLKFCSPLVSLPQSLTTPLQ